MGHCLFGTVAIGMKIQGPLTWSFDEIRGITADGPIIIGAAAIVAAVVAIVLVLKTRNTKKEALSKLDELASDISALYEKIARLDDFNSGYLMKKDWDAAIDSAMPTLSLLSKIPQKIIDRSSFAAQAAFLKKRCEDTSYREERNKRYKVHELELCDALLSDIDGGKSLDPQQRDAVVTDEYSNLVIAGAGSGKTSVVVGKVKYLVERWGVDPSDILVTSFTRASVDDLESRIKSSGVEGVSTRTFHSLGLRVLGNNFAVAAENALQKRVTSYLSNELASHPLQAAAFLEFFGLRNLTPNESPDSEEAEIRMRLLKAQDMRTLKGLVQESGHAGGMDTIRGERVKSIEELMIANFLFLNGVEYEYEKPYNRPIPEELRDGNRRAYQPDFYLVDYDIWLEHFGIDEHGRVPWMKTRVEEQDYLDGIAWKRQVHKACGTKLVESYSFWNKDQDLLNRIEVLLTSNGVVLNNDPERNAAICGDLLRDQRFFSSMSQLISTFISLVKSCNKSPKEIDDTAREKYKDDGAMWHRYDLFTRFAWPVMQAYQDSLAGGDKPEVDFDDMINMATDRIRKEGYGDSFRYIIVDEYQDISLSRFGLLSAIRDATGAKLLCVGDDWQSIYRFAGSDVTLFTNFSKLVGYYEEMRIERTYRNSQRLVDVASRFVLKNPDQMRKSVVSMAPAQEQPPVAVISLDDQRAAFTFALNDLLSSPSEGGEIKVLGRNRRDLERLFPGLAPTKKFSFRNPKKGAAEEEKFNKVIVYRPEEDVVKEIGYMTVHKSKGLQADNIILIGLVNDRYGFPNMIADDPILELLLADSDRYDFAEERRLFYVALTRTKNRVWLVTGDDSGYPGISMFVAELCRESDGKSLAFYSREESSEMAECPRCGGALVKRSGPSGDFVGCSNFPFCDKSYSDVRILKDRKRCPNCGGWLTRRTRKDGSGEFYGCTNYPTYCYYTMDLDGSNGSYNSGSVRTKPTTAYVYASTVPKGRSGTGGRPSNGGHGPRCPECGAPMTLKSGRYGEFYSCTKYPACKGKRNVEFQGYASRERRTSSSSGKGQSPRCPKCGAQMVLRTSKYGKFYGCPNYPKCDGKRDYHS